MLDERIVPCVSDISGAAVANPVALDHYRRVLWGV
jgi:hypothetical protein